MTDRIFIWYKYECRWKCIL